MKCFYSVFTALCFVVAAPSAVHAAYVVQDGKLMDQEEAATFTVQEHYSALLDAYQKKSWDEVVKQATIVIKNFSDTPFAHESQYYLGVGLFQKQELEAANRAFSAYLKKQTTPKFFEESIEYKFAIAEKFKNGAKKHLMGWKSMPQWLSAEDEAVAIYNEVIAALPHHDLGAQALCGKARLLLRDEDYKGSVEAYQTLIRRFPKHPLLPEAYLGIMEVYNTQCKKEYPDIDFFDLAQINLRKFQQDFPRDERVKKAEEVLLEMKEVYAGALLETGQFFERTKKPKASVIYYEKVVEKYRGTKAADRAQKRLDHLVREKKT